jgi:hypothetical protein
VVVENEEIVVSVPVWDTLLPPWVFGGGVGVGVGAVVVGVVLLFCCSDVRDVGEVVCSVVVVVLERRL